MRTGVCVCVRACVCVVSPYSVWSATSTGTETSSLLWCHIPYFPGAAVLSVNTAGEGPTCSEKMYLPDHGSLNTKLNCRATQRLNDPLLVNPSKRFLKPNSPGLFRCAAPWRPLLGWQVSNVDMCFSAHWAKLRWGLTAQQVHVLYVNTIPCLSPKILLKMSKIAAFAYFVWTFEWAFRTSHLKQRSRQLEQADFFQLCRAWPCHVTLNRQDGCSQIVKGKNP